MTGRSRSGIDLRHLKEEDSIMATKVYTLLSNALAATVVVFALAYLLVVMGGCNTFAGVGQMVAGAGQDITDAATKLSRHE